MEAFSIINLMLAVILPLLWTEWQRAQAVLLLP